MRVHCGKIVERIIETVLIKAIGNAKLSFWPVVKITTQNRDGMLRLLSIL